MSFNAEFTGDIRYIPKTEGKLKMGGNLIMFE